MPELERAPRIGRVEEILDRDTIGAVLREEDRQPRVNVQQFFREGRATAADGAADNDAMARAVRLDAAVTGAVGAGVDAKNPHASEASISFSSMSKFDQTCRMSSCSSRASMSFTICCAALPSSFR